MTISPARTSHDELQQLVRLHRDSLPSSLLSDFGPDVIKAYYEFLIESPTEHLALAKANGVIGAATVSFEPATLMKRVFQKKIRSLRFNLAVLASPFALCKAVMGLFEPDHIPASLQSMPEVVQLFTDGAQRRRGVGSELLAQIETMLRGRGLSAYYVKTVDDPSNTALEFYAKKGFERVDRQAISGMPLVFLKKNTQPQMPRTA